MTWHDLRDFAVLYGNECVIQRRQAAPKAKSRFPISCVLCEVYSGRNEPLFHWEPSHIESFGAWQTAHMWDNVSGSDTVSSAAWEAFPAQSSSVFMRETCFYLRECGCFSLKRSTNIPNDDVCRLVPLDAASCRLVPLRAASCRWCCFQWTVFTQIRTETISGTQSTAFDRICSREKVPADEVSPAIVNVHYPSSVNVT